MKDNYKAWEVREIDFPSSGTIEEQIRFLLNYGVLAPSIHNTQPWIFEIKNNELTKSRVLSGLFCCLSMDFY